MKVNLILIAIFLQVKSQDKTFLMSYKMFQVLKTQIKLTWSPFWDILIFHRLKLLKAFEDNFNSFKYGINPVFEIDTLGNIFIDDLSEPLAESIVPGWEPFFKKDQV
ncbi:MAG: hypothetical protein IPJ13_24100 [Saprospiraceae bacterium]|nr:hypothetical protein [Saprospiraceae bacterium]